MAKKPKSTASKEANHVKGAADQPGPASHAVVLIGEASLRALLKQDDNYKQRIDGLTGELREAIGNAVDKKHLHKKAYADVKRFHRCKSDEELAEWWHTLLAYMDMAGVSKRIDSVSRLPMGDDAADADDDADEERQAPQFGGAQASRVN